MPDPRERLRLRFAWLGGRARYGEPAVKWLSIRQLLRTATEVALSAVFARFADQRLTLPRTPVDHFALTPKDHTGAVRVDYAADTGDGFDATLAVGRLLVSGRDDHGVESGPARLLVLGGDEVYPVASAPNYRGRLTRVLDVAWALHGAGVATRPPVLALPGNHDWYDGLVSFRRTFCESWASVDNTLDADGLAVIGDLEPAAVGDRRDQAGGWRTVQSRSYFSVRVHPRWWMWGIDSQLDAPIDALQVEYFRRATARLQPGDGVVVCTATPSWLEADGDTPARFRHEETPLFTLTHFLRTVLDADDPRIRLLLTGDKHHYAHFAPEEQQPASTSERSWKPGPELVTCGGGGAFTSSTHHLPEHLSVPWGRPRAPAGGGPRPPAVATRYGRERTYPSKKQSEDMRAGIWKVGWRSGVIFPALLAGLLLWVFGSLLQHGEVHGPSQASLLPMGVTALVAAAFASIGLKGGAGESAWGRRAKLVLVVLGHLMLYAVCLAVAAAGWRLLPFAPAGAWVCVTLLFLVLGPFAFGIYLWASDKVGFHELEAFSAMRSTQYKSILRLTFEADQVRVTALGMPDVPSSRRKDQQLSKTSPALSCELIETFVVRREAGPATPAP